MKRRGQNGSSLSAIRYIGSKTFYKRGNDWQESVFDPEKHKQLKTVKVGSDEYFKLLKQDSRLAKYFALGDVVRTVKGKWYRIKS